MSSRPVRYRYHDPLDRIWVATASRLGFAIERTPDAYATSNGRGRIAIGTADTLDPDDSLAQMILHELCHALVEGPSAHDKPDWGLENGDERHRDREHACLRLQAALLARFGLTRLLAPTTDYRAFYDGLDDAPLRDAGEASVDPSVALARNAAQRADEEPWRTALVAALEATQRLALLVAPFEQSLGSPKNPDLPSLWLAR